MASAPPTNEIEISILRRIIRPEGKGMSKAAARSLLRLAFDQEDHDRVHALLVKNQEGKLTPQEEDELDFYLHIESFLNILHSKARMVLQQNGDRSGRRRG
jgi:hypothetical protein